MSSQSTPSDSIRHGLTLSFISNPERVVKYAVAAEDAGWDGVFHIDHLTDFAAQNPADSRVLNDPWITWAGVASRTEDITLGSSITPIPRRQPWQLAKNLATLDQLSDGRVLLGAGLGAPNEFEPFGTAYDQRRLADRYDEALDIITGLWSGEPFSYDGDHFSIDETVMRPTPVQEPRIPIVIGGWWPFKAPFRRGARWDGIIPNWPSMHANADYLDDYPDHMRRVIPDDPAHNEEVKEMLTYYHDLTDDAGEIILYSVGDESSGFAELCRDLGATWLIHGAVDPDADHEENLDRIRQGPPD